MRDPDSSLCQRYAVYHATDPLAMALPPDVLSQWWSNQRETHYRHVADVDAPFADLFALTNHIDRDWTENREVVWHAEGPVRSTSVGDVFACPATGHAWLVLPFGFQPL